uniref:Uncharacterized protein n=1 Tax=Chromera velia CCMP2878 TaxID=1169474 RepID=A0A0G4F845_9ALVE|eukprot:Cvel_15727.t1-p1 / transcript=Cvel_15727.t1 / gene=Cvel_15727 / organism=Chromera_velia_CCMP2878 / gene_product=hypothetical protein / transcript_product=hypothetical protein / location=Cvel_scaffold1176:12969-15252(-) / protein_length=630 / sequence_SO=supercontig / SO=protein_coding / is_pseudo=false
MQTGALALEVAAISGYLSLGSVCALTTLQRGLLDDSAGHVFSQKVLLSRLPLASSSETQKYLRHVMQQDDLNTLKSLQQQQLLGMSCNLMKQNQEGGEVGRAQTEQSVEVPLLLAIKEGAEACYDHLRGVVGHSDPTVGIRSETVALLFRSEEGDPALYPSWGGSTGWSQLHLAAAFCPSHRILTNLTCGVTLEKLNRPLSPGCECAVKVRNWREYSHELTCVVREPTPFHLAILRQNEEAIRVLAQVGADVSRPFSRVHVHFPETTRPPVFVAGVCMGSVRLLRLLLLLGADPEAEINARGDTSLHAAVEADLVEVVHELAKAGADCNRKAGKGLHPLLLAQSPAMIRALLHWGANPAYVRHNRGAMWQISSALQQQQQEEEEGDIIREWRVGVGKGAFESPFPAPPPVQKMCGGLTILQMAVKSGDGALVETCILEEGGSSTLDIPDSSGKTVLEYESLWENPNLLGLVLFCADREKRVHAARRLNREGVCPAVQCLSALRLLESRLSAPLRSSPVTTETRMTETKGGDVSLPSSVPPSPLPSAPPSSSLLRGGTPLSPLPSFPFSSSQSVRPVCSLKAWPDDRTEGQGVGKGEEDETTKIENRVDAMRKSFELLSRSFHDTLGESQV